MPTYLQPNLWTEMTGITTVEQYEQLHGPGSYQREREKADATSRRIADMMRFEILADGRWRSVDAFGVHTFRVVGPGKGQTA